MSLDIMTFGIMTLSVMITCKQGFQLIFVLKLTTTNICSNGNYVVSKIGCLAAPPMW